MTNKVSTNTWSNKKSSDIYQSIIDGAAPQELIDLNDASGCLFCVHYGQFSNSDWGVCCNEDSDHFTETLFEHFVCPSFKADKYYGLQSVEEHIAETQGEKAAREYMRAVLALKMESYNKESQDETK